VTLQRLPVNSLNLELLQELCTIFDALEKDKSRGMILTSVSEHPHYQSGEKEELTIGQKKKETFNFVDPFQPMRVTSETSPV
jgi:enoyl-CoA hydratase/carnithine racemase